MTNEELIESLNGLPDFAIVTDGIGCPWQKLTVRVVTGDTERVIAAWMTFGSTEAITTERLVHFSPIATLSVGHGQRTTAARPSRLAVS